MDFKNSQVFDCNTIAVESENCGSLIETQCV
jgi:hypothetical protein